MSAYYSAVDVVKVNMHTDMHTHACAHTYFSPCWLGSIQWSGWPLGNLSPELGQVSVFTPGGRLLKSCIRGAVFFSLYSVFRTLGIKKEIDEFALLFLVFDENESW